MQRRWICEGDLGGPLYPKNPETDKAECLYGVTAYTSNETCYHDTAIFTRVSAQVGWINRNMKDYSFICPSGHK